MVAKTKSTLAERSRINYQPEKAAPKSPKKPQPAPSSPVKGESGARPKSQQVKHKNRVVIPEGLGVEAAWCSAIEANRTHHVTDEVITAWMQEAFPGRESNVFLKVQSVRYKFNKGRFSQTKGVPETLSQRYDEAGNVATARGKSLSSPPGEPAEGEALPTGKGKKTTQK